MLAAAPVFETFSLPIKGTTKGTKGILLGAFFNIHEVLNNAEIFTW